MNIPNRAIVRSVAASLVKLEQKEGKQYPADAVAHIWAVDYDLVEKEEDIAAFKQQVALEVEAERFSVKHSTKLKKAGALELKLASLAGTLTAGPKSGSDLLPE